MRRLASPDVCSLEPNSSQCDFADMAQGLAGHGRFSIGFDGAVNAASRRGVHRVAALHSHFSSRRPSGIDVNQDGSPRLRYNFALSEQKENIRW